ncbi:NTP transferase domain-containing protein [Leptolyngbya sp. 15MV]|nr:NTP transferase domain-containing protein [Leptolyngbya sp. 15MV]
MTATTNVLVLAGQRPGRVDPLAVAAGVSHKCLVPVHGQALIGHVLDTIEQALPSSPIFLSIEPSAEIDREPSVARLLSAGRLHIVPAQPNLVDSVIAAAPASGFPLLITTADNALLTRSALRLMVDFAARSACDGILGVARKSDIQAAHPGGKGRYYEFRDGSYSNCNLFWLGSPGSLKAAEAFRGGGQFLKIAGRMAKAFGVLNLLLYRSRLLTLEQAFRAVSMRFGVTVKPLVFDDGRLAIDVDDERSKQMVEELLLASS